MDFWSWFLITVIIFIGTRLEVLQYFNKIQYKCIDIELYDFFGELAESRVLTRSYVVLQYQFITYKGFCYANGNHFNKYASDYALYTLCTFIDHNIEFTRYKCVLQYYRNYFCHCFQRNKNIYVKLSYIEFHN